MKLRKLFAWLMALVMLLGMVPAGHAEGGNITPGGDITVGCNHNWDWRFPNGEPKHCQEERLMEMYCTLCGQVASSYPVTGDHTPGSWRWDGNPPANCYEWGIQNQFCSVCGKVFNEREVQGEHQWSGYVTETPAGCEAPGEEVSYCTVCGERGNAREIPPTGHDWGDWRWDFEATCQQEGLRVRYCERCKMREEDYVQGNHLYGDWKVDEQPTCTERGLKYKACAYCGNKEWAYIPMIDHVMGDWRVIEEPQVGIPGTERRACIYGCGTHEDRDIPPLEEAISLPGLELTLVLSSTPANGQYFVVGEEVVFTETWSNGTGKTLYPFSVSIFNCVEPVFGSEIDQMCSWFAEDAGGPVVPGATGSHTLTVTVTEADVARGAIYATAELLSTVENGPDLENVTTPFVTAPCGEEETSYTTAIDLEIVELPVAENVKPGDVLTAKLKVTNTGETTVTLNSYFLLDANGNNYDAASPDSWNKYQSEPLSSWFPAGASLTTDLDITVTESSIADGEIRFTYTQNARPFYVVVNGVETDIPADLVPTPEGTTGWYVKEEEKVSDSVEIVIPLTSGNPDVDGDGIPNGDDPDVDGDGTPNGDDPDMDGDGIPNGDDPDVDGDGIHNGDDPDMDGDGTPNEEDPDYKPAAGLTVDMTYTNTPANGSFFTPGEVIDYLITVTNPGSDTLTNLQVGNSSSEAVVPAPSEIAPGQTIQVRYYKLVYEGDAKAGGINSYGHAHAFNGDPALPESLVSGRSTDVFVPCGMGDGTPSVYYLKIVANAPANGLYFTEGETIKYRLSFGNNTKKDIYNITLNDPMANTRSVAFARRLKAGEFLMGEFEYVVTAADVAAGEIVNTATSTWATKAEGAQTKTPSNTVVTPTGDESILRPGDPAANEVSLTKQILNAPANGQYFVPGEEIQFSVTVQNNLDKTLDIVVLTDPLSADFFHELLDVPGGAMDSRTLNYTVTEFDAEIGSVINYAYAVVYVDGKPHSMTSNSVTAPCGFPDKDGDGQPDDPFGIHTALEVVKSVESLPLNGSYYQTGEMVSYKITYTNAGESVLTDVMIFDVLAGMTEIASAEMLQPGESRTCFFSYTVTDFDVHWGYIANTAVGQYMAHNYLNTVNSNTVFVDTNGTEDRWIVWPIYPDEIPDETVPPSGTIDTDQLHSGAASCVRTITGRDNVSAEYELSFCAEHADTQASVLTMMRMAATPDMQQQTAAYAVALWRGEVEALYQKIFSAADPMAKAAVMTEYIRFLTEVANYEALLKTLHPDQPALAAKMIAAVWEDKCVTLCYEMHTTAAQRKDSLLSVTPATGASAAECACTTTDEVNGKKAYTQSYCPVHGFPFSMIDMLLQGQDTAEAWTMVRQIWSVELTNAYNQAAAKLGANSALAMAEYNALTQWMTAREASLIALYPNNPEVVAQTMVKLIMDRVNELCQVTK